MQFIWHFHINVIIDYTNVHIESIIRYLDYVLKKLIFYYFYYFVDSLLDYLILFNQIWLKSVKTCKLDILVNRN